MYIWFRTWQLGVKSLLLHPLRSLLTVLGIFIGVSSVIWLLAIGEGISQKAQEQIENLGATNIIVRTVKPSADSEKNQSHILTYGIQRADYEVLAQSIPSIVESVPIREMRRKFTAGNQEMEGRLVGCTPEYAEINKLKLARGHFLTTTECEAKKNYCVLANETAERLFRFANPIGKNVKVEESFYQVVGVLEPRQATAAIGGSLDAQEFNTDIYIPIKTLWERMGDLTIIPQGSSQERTEIELSQITLQVASVNEVEATAKAVETILSARRPDGDYAITVPLELLEQARTTRLMFILFMGMIAAISLVVGGIGIMNIMLATVTERTREIGIRRALGAKRSDITRQFLVETVALSSVGGIVGILVGFTCGPIIEFGKYLMKTSFPTVMASLPPEVVNMSPIIVPWSIPVAFIIAVGIGVIFGLYPARRAAMMDPIEALRDE